MREATALGDRRAPTPLAGGYATFGSDSGHHHHYLLLPDRYNALKPDFASNDEQRKNFAGDALNYGRDAHVERKREREDPQEEERRRRRERLLSLR